MLKLPMAPGSPKSTPKRAQHRAQNHPRGFQKAKIVDPRRSFIFKQIPAQISAIWGPQNGTKNHSKSALAPLGSLLAASGASGAPPVASRRPSESDFRAQNATKPCKKTWSTSPLYPRSRIAYRPWGPAAGGRSPLNFKNKIENLSKTR